MKFSYKFALIASLLLLCLSFSGAFAQTSSITGVVSPTMNTLNSVFVVNNVTATSNDLTMLDAWAVGDSGAIVRWNGTGWAISNSNTTANLNGVFFVNSSYGWAVGDNNGNGIILNYNGAWKNWQLILNNVTSAANNTVAAPLYAITGDVNGTVGWAVGANGTIYGWNSTLCYSVPSGTNATLRAVGMVHNSNEAWAAGDNGTILYYSNQTNTWSKMPTPVNTNLYTIAMLNATYGWAAGGNNANNGTVLNLNGASWSNWNRFLFGTNATSPQQSINSTIYSISLGNETSGWGVGTNGMVMYFNGTDWTCNANIIGGTLRGVSMVHGITGINEAWAVGDSGLILAFTGTRWVPEIPVIALPVLLSVGLVIVLFGKAKLFKKTLY